MSGVGRVGKQDDVPRLRHRVDERLVRIGAADPLAAHLEAVAAVVLEEQHVVDDEAGRPAREEVDDQAVDDARPGPAAGERLHLAQRLLVDLDHRDLRRRVGRVDGLAHPQVVERPLDGARQRQNAQG